MLKTYKFSFKDNSGIFITKAENEIIVQFWYDNSYDDSKKCLISESLFDAFLKIVTNEYNMASVQSYHPDHKSYIEHKMEMPKLS